MKHRNALARLCLISIVLSVPFLGCDITPSTAEDDLTKSPSPLPASTDNFSVQSPSAVTYYVRPDGGSPEQCTGLVNTPYPGSGTGQACAWDHPFHALPPDDAPNIMGGDTVIIAQGSYRMGYGASGADNCYAEGAYDCHMPPIPSGPDAAHPTRILGAGWDSGCANPPELWGTQRPWFIINLTDASNVEIVCLEITDHSECVEDHAHGVGGSQFTCQRDTYPFGDWAPIGIYAEDSNDVHLQHLNIHGLANTGIHAGRLSDWTVEDVRIVANGWAGWDGDIDGDDSNSGTLTFMHWTVAWNGCAETYPDNEPIGCWSQTTGGYGDGIGTGTTGGHWIIEDAAFLYNTSDGLDLLYTREAGSLIEIRRTIAEGNAGDQIKTTGPTMVENVIAVSNCNFFNGKSFTYNVDNCRAGGSAMAFTLRENNEVTVINSTITGQGDCLIITECIDGQSCNGSETVILQNDIFLGNPDVTQPGDTTCLAWYGTPHNPFNLDHAIINSVKGMPSPCPDDSLCNLSPGLEDEGIDSFNARLLSSSPAIDMGDNGVCPATDYIGYTRPVDGDGDGTTICDIGAYEYWEPTAWIYIPVTLTGM